MDEKNRPDLTADVNYSKRVIMEIQALIYLTSNKLGFHSIKITWDTFLAVNLPTNYNCKKVLNIIIKRIGSFFCLWNNDIIRIMQTY